MADRLCTCGHRESDHFLTGGVCLIDDSCPCLKFEPLSTTAEQTVKRLSEEEFVEEPDEETEEEEPEDQRLRREGWVQLPGLDV
jgi:hypothetical protein